MKNMRGIPKWAWYVGGAAAALVLLVPSKAREGSFPVRGSHVPSRRLLQFGYARTATHTHQGIDIPGRIGQEVLAAYSGVVTHAWTSLTSGFSGYGRGVVIRSPNFWTMYAHMDRVYVSAGERVTGGQVIGTVGKTCFRRSDPQAQCGGPHLHFEVSPRPYPQAAEAWRYDPVAILSGRSPGSVNTTRNGALLA